MAFDTRRFLKSRLEPRTESVPVPDLADYFGDGEQPVWTIRQLTGEELARADDAAGRNKQAAALLKAMMSGAKEKTEALQELTGFSDAVPDAMAKRIEHLMAGSVDPACDRELALRLFTHFPVVAWQLSNRILELTGKGAVTGEPKRSTPTPESGIA